MFCPFLEQVATVPFEMADVFAPFQTVMCSWTTLALGSLFKSTGSSMSRIASRILTFASSNVLPCVKAPGTSADQPIHQRPCFRNVARYLFGI